MERTYEYKPGIDAFEVGQLVVINFPSMMDENIVNTKKYKNKDNRKRIIKREVQSGAKLPAIILEKNKDDKENLLFPTYTVGIITRTNTGEVSGIIEIKEFCVWRYLAKDSESTEGTPPEWLIESIKNTKRWCDIDSDKIFYTSGNKKIYIN